VIAAFEAVAEGAETHADIARALGNYTVRQGQYYRAAAELVGLVRTLGAGNGFQVTPEGQRVLAMTGAERHLHLAGRVASLPLVRLALDRLRESPYGCQLADIYSAVSAHVPNTTPGMVRRRTATIMSWLRYFGLVKEAGGAVRLAAEPTESGMQDALADWPGGRKSAPNLRAIADTRRLAPSQTVREEGLTYLVNTATRHERASETHQRLVSDVASHLDWLFVMKSCIAQDRRVGVVWGDCGGSFRCPEACAYLAQTLRLPLDAESS